VQIKTFLGFLNVIGVYAPVEDTKNDSEEFYKLLQKMLETMLKSDMTSVMKDLNATVGNNRTVKCISNTFYSGLLQPVVSNLIYANPQILAKLY
jgi:hypothetical protein